ncbi:MAG: 50S ribosomal protein L22, partial [Actinomycetota bacterium]
MARQAGELAQQATAGARYVRVSASKVRVVAALIRGKHVDEARRILAFTPKAASHHLSKVLESAIANAEHNFDIPGDELYVWIAAADEGPTLKRIRPRAQGRAYRV